MQDKQIQRKQEKAQGYALHPELFRMLDFKLQMKSTHGVRLITYSEGEWKCTCDFFRERSTCSHIMAAGRILESLSLKQPFGNEQEGKR
jgi:hypothetical protein